MRSIEEIPGAIAREEERRNGKYHPSPEDWRDIAIYFLLVDRFDDTRDQPKFDPIQTPRNFSDRPWVDFTPCHCCNQNIINTNKGNVDPGKNISLAGTKWQGGKIQGITRRLEYIKELGFNAIWLSPIYKNRKETDTYHGYAIQNYLEVDPHFGTLQDLQDLVREAHTLGMYVILDIVLNHTGDNWGYEGDFPPGKAATSFKADGQYPLWKWRSGTGAPIARSEIADSDDAVWPEEFQNENWYERRGRIGHGGWDIPEVYRHGDLFTLKKLNTNNPDVLDALIAIHKYWIAATDIDGYRLDAVKHIGGQSVARFCDAIREFALKRGKGRFFMFGEILGDDILINGFLGKHPHLFGVSEAFSALDGALNNPLWAVLSHVIKGILDVHPMQLMLRYEMWQNLFPEHVEAPHYFVNYVDNHDQPGRDHLRFLSSNQYPDQAVLAIGYLLTSIGIPCIYYGTEQGFDGGGNNDMYIRECMFGGTWGGFRSAGHHFFDEDNDIYKKIQKIAAIRQKEPTLRYGRQYFRSISTNGGNDFGFPDSCGCTLAYSRILDDTETLVAMNLSCDISRNDFVAVDAMLMPSSGTLIDQITLTKYTIQEKNGRRMVQVPLARLQMVILKLVP